jgi:aminoglycoside 6-adenylyltransferase
MDELERRFEEWALARPDVRVLVVVGSRARRDHPADEWADLDLGVVTRDPKRYSTDASWLSEIAEPWVVHRDRAGVTWHVLFAGGLDAGIAPLRASTMRYASWLLPPLKRMPNLRRVLPAPLRRGIEGAEQELVAYCGRGVRVLVDKDGLARRLFGVVPAAPQRVSPPSEGEYRVAVDEFWFVAVWYAKHLRRGEFWHAKMVAGDGRMKSLLLQMLEWHAQAARGADTWEDGRFLEEWADPRARHELGGLFAHYDKADLWRSGIATTDSFRWLARETADLLGYSYPADTDARVTAWITECREGAQPS